MRAVSLGELAATRHTLLSPPLWGRGGEGGTTSAGAWGSPPSLTLPHKGGGNGECVPTLTMSAHDVRAAA